jgi:hypothetical protein
MSVPAIRPVIGVVTSVGCGCIRPGLRITIVSAVVSIVVAFFSSRVSASVLELTLAASRLLPLLLGSVQSV